MKGVQHNLHVWLVDGIHVIHTFLARVNQITLKSVKRFHVQNNPVIRRYLCQLLHSGNTTFKIGRLVQITVKLNRPVGIQCATQDANPSQLHLFKHSLVKFQSMPHVIRFGGTNVIFYAGSITTREQDAIVFSRFTHLCKVVIRFSSEVSCSHFQHVKAQTLDPFNISNSVSAPFFFPIRVVDSKFHINCTFGRGAFTPIGVNKCRQTSAFLVK